MYLLGGRPVSHQPLTFSETLFEPKPSGRRGRRLVVSGDDQRFIPKIQETTLSWQVSLNENTSSGTLTWLFLRNTTTTTTTTTTNNDNNNHHRVSFFLPPSSSASSLAQVSIFASSTSCASTIGLKRFRTSSALLSSARDGPGWQERSFGMKQPCIEPWACGVNHGVQTSGEGAAHRHPGRIRPIRPFWSSLALVSEPSSGEV